MKSEEEAGRAIEQYADMVRRICMIHLKNYEDAEDIFQNGSGNEYPTVFEADETYNALHVEGQRVLMPDIGFVWNSGLTEAMDSIVFYIYNDTDATMSVQHSWGVVVTLAPHSWTRIEASCIQGHIDGYKPDGSGSQAGKNDEGEYFFFIPVKIAGVAEGATNIEGGETYSLYVFASYRPN